MKKSIYFFHILGLNLKISYQIVSLFDMYMDMGERIAGITGFQIVSPCCTYVSIVMRAAFDDISVALVPLDFM